jgi:PAS domain-containing protein
MPPSFSRYIRKQLFVNIGLVMLISTILMGLLAYSTLRNQQLQTWEKILQTQAEDIESEINLTLTRQRWLLERAALSENLRDAIIAVVRETPHSAQWEAKAALLQESLLVAPPGMEIDEFLVLDADTGYVTLSNHHAKERLPFPDIWFFQTTLRGTHLSIQRACGQTACTAWGTPVYDRHGRRVAVLIMVFPTTPFREIADNYRQWAGTRQEILLIDETRHNLLASEETTYHTTGVNLAFSEGNGIAVYLNAEGEKVLGAYRAIKALGAALLLEVPYAQVMAAANRATLSMLAAGLGLLLVLLLMETFIANAILMPVKRILDGIERVSAGDLDTHLPEMENPDLAWMARRFNRMVQELKNTYLEMEAQKKSYVSLFEDSPDGILLLDTNGIIIQHNLGWLELLRLPPQSNLAGNPISRYFHISAGIWQTLLTQKRLRIRGHLHLPDGSTCPTDVRCKVLENGEIQMIFTDISDQYRLEKVLRKQQYQLEKQVQQRTAQLQAANQELESFAYSVSHDLRAPLRAIRGYLTIFLEEHGSQLSDEQRSLLEKIQSSAERLSDMIQHLLTISRLGR